MPNKSPQAEPLLYLVHRIPYPPNKGDKLRSFNILRQLSASYRVHLGTFIDDPDDLAHIPRLREWCADVHVETINPRIAKLASLRGLATGEALSVPYYRSRALRQWVERTISTQGIRKALAFSGPMAQYLDAPGLQTRVIDFCDLDSAKWTAYGPDRPWPLSWLYRREGEKLFEFERVWAGRAEASTFVTPAEAALMCQRAPELAPRVSAVENGVDADFFSPAHTLDNPYIGPGPAIVFTGAMDYWPNIDAVCWFAQDILPGIRAVHPQASFTIVGMNPASAVQALAGPHVSVTGKVPDTRPWLAHADLVVAPLRIARGIQNKVLEAMAMAKPVVVSAASATGLHGEAGQDFVTADTAAQFIDACLSLLAEPERRQSVAARARHCVERQYSWQTHLGRFDSLLAGQGA